MDVLSQRVDVSPLMTVPLMYRSQIAIGKLGENVALNPVDCRLRHSGKEDLDQRVDVSSLLTAPLVYRSQIEMGKLCKNAALSPVYGRLSYSEKKD